MSDNMRNGLTKAAIFQESRKENEPRQLAIARMKRYDFRAESDAAMLGEAFASALAFVASHGYFFIFLAMIVEGPVVTTAAAFAASLGYFDIWIIVALSVGGDLAGDFLHYVIGRIGRMAVVNQVLRLFRISDNVLQRVEALLHSNLGKSMLLIKFLPLLATPGLMLTGALNAPLGQFVLYSFVITTPRALFFSGLGYFAGKATTTVLTYFSWAQYSLLFVVIAAVGGVFVFRAISALIVRRLNKD